MISYVDYIDYLISEFTFRVRFSHPSNLYSIPHGKSYYLDMQ